MPTVTERETCPQCSKLVARNPNGRALRGHDVAGSPGTRCSGKATSGRLKSTLPTRHRLAMKGALGTRFSEAPTDTNDDSSSAQGETPAPVSIPVFQEAGDGEMAAAQIEVAPEPELVGEDAAVQDVELAQEVSKIEKVPAARTAKRGAGQAATRKTGAKKAPARRAAAKPVAAKTAAAKSRKAAAAVNSTPDLTDQAPAAAQEIAISSPTAATAVSAGVALGSFTVFRRDDLACHASGCTAIADLRVERALTGEQPLAVLSCSAHLSELVVLSA